MARELKRSDRNKLAMIDPQTGDRVVLFYASPTAEQFRKYRQASVKYKGNKVEVDSFGPALRFGGEILTGFEYGAFSVDGKNFSFDPTSPDFREDWKALVNDCAADLVATLGSVVFDGVRIDKADPEEEAVTEDVIPLGTK